MMQMALLVYVVTSLARVAFCMIRSDLIGRRRDRRYYCYHATTIIIMMMMILSNNNYVAVTLDDRVSSY